MREAGLWYANSSDVADASYTLVAAGSPRLTPCRGLDRRDWIKYQYRACPPPGLFDGVHFRSIQLMNPWPHFGDWNFPTHNLRSQSTNECAHSMINSTESSTTIIGNLLSQQPYLSTSWKSIRTTTKIPDGLRRFIMENLGTATPPLNHDFNPASNEQSWPYSDKQTALFRAICGGS